MFYRVDNCSRVLSVQPFWRCGAKCGAYVLLNLKNVLQYRSLVGANPGLEINNPSMTRAGDKAVNLAEIRIPAGCCSTAYYIYVCTPPEELDTFREFRTASSAEG